MFKINKYDYQAVVAERVSYPNNHFWTNSQIKGT